MDRNSVINKQQRKALAFINNLPAKEISKPVRICFSILLFLTMCAVLGAKWLYFNCLHETEYYTYEFVIPYFWSFTTFLNIIFQVILPAISVVALLNITTVLFKQTGIMLAFASGKSFVLSFQKAANTLFVLFPPFLFFAGILPLYNIFKLSRNSINRALKLIILSMPVESPYPEFNIKKVFITAVLLTAAFLLIIVPLPFSIEKEKEAAKKQKTRVLFKILSIISYLFVFLAILLTLSTHWVFSNFGNVTADQFLFQIKVPLQGVNTDFIANYILFYFVPALFFFLCVFLVIWPIRPGVYKYSLQAKGRGFSLSFFNKAIGKAFIMLLSISLFALSVFNLNRQMGLIEYIKRVNTRSDFIDRNYVDPRSVELAFPEKKRNLIFIFLESIENTYMSEEYGGAAKENLIPELTALARENISFSNSDTLGGAYQVTGTGWTIAAMVSHHGGLPFLFPLNGNDYGKYETFLPDVWTLGDILEKEGYKQTLIVGSDASFGGRRSFYSQHGNYKILDLYTAWEDGLVPSGQKLWWGFDDIHLYEYAKKELEGLSRKNEPFNLSILTVDTHSPGGYVCPQCTNSSSEQYWNVISCASRQLNDFILWLKQQSYYEDTSIVIVGDHLSMDNAANELSEGGYWRTTYNTWINSAVTTEDINNRLFCTMDIFPTTLASMGVKIEGDRLALGTNLFSDEATLIEEYGFTKFNNSLQGSSDLYDSLLWGTYDEYIRRSK